MKKLLSFIIAMSLIVCTSCSSGRELADDIISISDADNKYVNMVKGGYRASDPDIKYEFIFSSFFGTPRWTYFFSEDGLDVVEFTGDCIYRDVTVRARIQFVVDEDAGTFDAVYLAFNEVPQDALTLNMLLTTAFDNAKEEWEAINAQNNRLVNALSIDPIYIYTSLIDSVADIDFDGKYAFYDIDGNGTSECFVHYNDYDNFIKIYTYDNGRYYELLEFGSRSQLIAIDNDGYIYNISSNGAVSHGHSIYRISDDYTSIIVVEYLFSDYMQNVFEYTTLGFKRSISEQEYEKLINSFNDRAIDEVLWKLVWVSVSGSYDSNSNGASVNNKLTVDEARVLFNSWLYVHPNVPTMTIKLSESSYSLNGESYYLFSVDEMYYLDVMVHDTTGEIRIKYMHQGPDPAPPYTVQIDDWYDTNYTIPPVTMSIRGFTAPPDQYVGAIFGVKGIVESDYEIYSVTVAVLNSRGDVETSGTAYPFTYSYDLKNLDYDILFDKLTPGRKTYVCEATDKTGTYYWEHSFQVFSR
ncbi:MAG: hypothetical protein FWG88_10925 [Oscillospiraceae bacterium]|nr:hypothetical protein [Oscillospiraceae bacterium]